MKKIKIQSLKKIKQHKIILITQTPNKTIKLNKINFINHVSPFYITNLLNRIINGSLTIKSTPIH